MAIVLVILLFVLSFFLIKSADLVVVAIHRLTKGAGSKAFALSAMLLALATSFPELSVAITSSLEGAPSLSLGNVLGSNIANVSLVAGLSAFMVGRVNVHGAFLKRDVYLALLAGILPLVLVVIGGGLSRVDGLILLSAYGAYATSFFKQRFLEIAEGHRRNFFFRFFKELSQIDGSTTKETARLFIGVGLLLVSANLIVRTGVGLAELANIPVFLVGLILLSIGTTLPELAFSLRSLKDKEPTMFFGNLLGSIIANSTLIIGIAATISPIEVVAIGEYTIAAAVFVIVYLVFWFFIRSKLKLERWEAAVLLLIYLVFVVIQFLK